MAEISNRGKKINKGVISIKNKQSLTIIIDKFEDSTGKPIEIGDRVKFRGRFYTINGFIPKKGRWGCAMILFGEKCHTSEKPDEISVDKVN